MVHNGIIENFKELREQLEKKGANSPPKPIPRSRSNWSPIISPRAFAPIEAMEATLPHLRGAFALGFIFAGEDDLMIGARKGSRSRSASATMKRISAPMRFTLAPFTNRISYLEDGDGSVLTRGSSVIRSTMQGAIVQSRDAKIASPRR